MTDRTDAFLLEVTAFLEADFTGEIVLHCQNGRILEMQLKQRITVAEHSISRSSALLSNSSALTAVGSRT